MPRKKAIKPTFEAQNRAAIYLRVSTEEQAEGYGLEDQRAKCLDYARLYGYPIIGEFRDEGISGKLDETHRDELKRLLATVERGECEIVIVAALDRIARKASLQLRILEELESHGAVIHSVKERIDTSTPAGRLLRTVLAGVAEMEREIIVERTSGGRNQRGKLDGERGGRVPYGYVRTFDPTSGKANGVRIDREAAQIVRQIFQLRKRRHWTLAKIAETLPEPGPRGGAWHPTSVREILKNEAAYRGGTRGESQVAWPAILKKETS